MSPENSLELLNKSSVSELAELSGFIRSCISKVKHGKCRPSEALLSRIYHFLGENASSQKHYLALFLQSRLASGVSAGSLQFYRVKLGRFLGQLNADVANRIDIERFLLQFGNSGNRHAYYRAVKTFYNWREETFELASPMTKVKALRLAKLILPSLTVEQVLMLIETVGSTRDKAIIALLTENGLRLSELANIRIQDIDWDSKTIKVLDKAGKKP